MATEKRLIDADALDGILKDFENRYQKACFVLSAKAIANARQIVYAMKTVDAVEVVHGHFIKVTELCGIDVLKCSVCGMAHPRKASAYCPDCGAKMDGDGNGT